MKTIDVIILKGGRTAKEINYLGEKPAKFLCMTRTKSRREKFKKEMNEWKEVERNRRTFEIDFSHLIPVFKAIEEKVGGKIHHVHIGFDEGACRKAQILHNAKIKIL